MPSETGVEKHTITETENEPNNSKPGLRNVLYVVLIIFFIALAGLAFAAARLATQATASIEEASAVVEPFGDRVRQLFIPATPVILPNAATIVHQINDMARLQTASYELEKVVTADSGQDGLLELFLGDSLVFVAYGKVIAGVDFGKMGEQDLVVVDPDTVMVHLPPAEIFTDIPILDNERSYVADRDTGLLSKADPELETKVRQTAERAILEAAQSSDIAERANYNAQQFMLNFLQGLGFENVIFTQDVPPEAPPYEQPIPKGYFLLPTATPAPTGG